MRVSRIVASLFVGLLAFTWVPGSADTQAPPRRIVEMRAGEFVPYAILAQVNDVIVFRAMAGGVDVAAYKNANFDSSSQYPAGMSPYNEFEWQYTGGDVYFRSPKKSELDAGGSCTGMCGVITATAPQGMPAAPAITSPTGAVALDTHSVSIAGTVSGATKAIRLQKEIKKDEYRDLYVLKFEGTGENRSWEQTLEFPNATYTIRAIAVHPGGFFSGPSVPVTFTVAGPDTQNPVVQVSSPKDPLILESRLQISGRAVDDVKIASVAITVTDDVTGSESTPSVRLEVDPAMPNSLLFYASLPLGPGSYTVEAVATDTSGKTGAASKSVIMVL
ncbi:MAG: hypothetical protein WDA27_13740 [Actinomycetota bacterium]